MKKYLLLLLIPLLIGCQKEEIKEEKVEEPTHIVQEEEEEDKYVDTNPIKVGLYKDGKLITEYHKKFTRRSDIAIFNILFTSDEKLINGKVKNIWKTYYDKYTDIDEYKIGFEISFEANGEKYHNLLLNPQNQHKLRPYLFAYLYDDVHSSGRYSHLTMDDIKDNTIFSSIKLYLHDNTNEISSPITLSVFTYKDENDFIDEHYRGNSIHTITIYNK